MRYEAFNTSGGLGTLCDTLDGRVRELNYKTIRYPGHRDLVMFLVNDLLLSRRRDVLKDILEQAIPVTFQDVVVTFCTVTGRRKNQLVQISDARTIHSQLIDGEAWSAIQITTAAGVCARAGSGRRRPAAARRLRAAGGDRLRRLPGEPVWPALSRGLERSHDPGLRRGRRRDVEL